MLWNALKVRFWNALMVQAILPKIWLPSKSGYQQELDDAKAEYAALQNARLNEAAEIRKLRTYYDEFRGWEEEFDAAPLEIKRMILSQLIERVEVGRKYQVTIKLNMEYQQFLEITEEQKLIPLISA